jgi:hypothetical protein
MDSKLQNNSLPKIFDETCKIEKNARMIVEEFFSFPERYFIGSWLEDKASKTDSHRINQDENGPTNVNDNNISMAVATNNSRLR